jgi:hypothetical protein
MLTRLEGRMPITLGAEQVDQLRRMGIRPTDDSEKYEWYGEAALCARGGNLQHRC